jgi:hypothetical protein
MMGTFILQQLIGMINLSLPLILLYALLPNFILSFWGIVCCSLGVGLYVAYMTYRTTHNQARGLQFIPSEKYTQIFNQEIVRCGLEPKNVALRYAYTDDGVAMTLFNTITIDPMFWKEIDDPEFLKTRGVIEQYILPHVPENKKTLHAHINAILTPLAQRFIFKHELGHILYNYSNKRVIVAGILGTLAAAAGMYTAQSTITARGGLVSLVLGIAVGGLIDILAMYASNIFFKAREEKKADIFACKFSSKEEILAAADFFEQYEYHAQEYRASIGGFIAWMPTIIISGYIDGVSRADYLRNLSH